MVCRAREAALDRARPLVRLRCGSCCIASWATAAWLVSGERYHAKRNAALAAYFLQLALNAAWAPLFFGAWNIGAGLFVLVALWLTVAWTIRAFAPVRATAAVMLVPYVVWITYAMALNFSVWRLNQ